MIPDGFTVEYDVGGSIVPSMNCVEIDISGKRLYLNRYSPRPA